MENFFLIKYEVLFLCKKSKDEDEKNERNLEKIN